MKTGRSRIVFVAALLGLASDPLSAYPIDGYAATGIRRLERLRLVAEGTLSGPGLSAGSKHPLADIRLNLQQSPGAELEALPAPDPELQRRLDQLFGGRDPSYSLALLDISPGRPIRLAARQADRSFEPGSVGKLAIAAGVFAELKALYPNSPERRRELLRSRMVVAGDWILHDHHPVPVYDLESRSFTSRPAQKGDAFSLYEWIDHMLSASANSAASTVWKETILIRAFGPAYPPSREQEAEFFAKTSPQALQKLAVSTVNDPLRAAGIVQRDWQLGSFFTQTGKRRVPGVGSWATPRGLLLYLVRLEQGRIVDEWSSLEIKRLMYMTARRIRYASSPAIARSKVYFKSGSLYRCVPEEGFDCGKYRGNKTNVMNSVAIVETSDGRVYLVALTSDVLRKNSAVEHQNLATEVEQLMKN